MKISEWLREAAKTETQTKPPIEWVIIGLKNPRFTKSSVIDMYTMCRQQGLDTHMDKPGKGTVYITRSESDANTIELWFRSDKIAVSKAEAIAKHIAERYDPEDF